MEVSRKVDVPHLYLAALWMRGYLPVGSYAWPAKGIHECVSLHRCAFSASHHGPMLKSPYGGRIQSMPQLLRVGLQIRMC